MARINIEDAIAADFRFRRLVRKLGDEDKAYGMLIRFWRIAQVYWCEDESLVPQVEFDAEELQPILDSGLAEVRENGIYARGSEKHFAWYSQRVKAGKKRAEAPRNENGHFITSDPAAGQRNTSEPSNSHQPLTLALAPTQIQENTNTIQAVANASASIQEPKNLPEEITPGIPTPKRSKFSENTRQKMRAFIASYAKGYQEKYKCKAPDSLKDKALIGKLGHWIEHVSEVRAVSLVEVYLQITYRPFDENFHDLWQFFRHLNRIGHALDTGTDANTTDWSKVFAGGS